MPRAVVKERLEICLCQFMQAARVRPLLARVWASDDHCVQPPSHNIETGAQDKPALDDRGGKVPLM